MVDNIKRKYSRNKNDSSFNEFFEPKNIEKNII
jgi:hypothetical protein